MSPCEDDEAALRWLEDNPPDEVSVPALQVNQGGVAVAYRDDGTIKKTKQDMVIKKNAKRPDVSVAVQGSFAWTWSKTPPAQVLNALTALCPDVPYLGTTESPVRLSTSLEGQVQSTHALDREAGLFTTVAGEDVEVPVTGRYAELARAHEGATGPGPSAARDKWSADEASRSHVPPREAVALARYTPVDAPTADVPWPDVLLLPLDRPVPETYRVGLAVAAHRALIRAIGENIPPLISGAYPTRIRPANRLAIQIIDPSMPVDLPPGCKAALALLIPRGAEPADLDRLAHGVTQLTSVRGPGGHLHRITGKPRRVSGAEFWNEPASALDTLRVWHTAPAAIPDTRGGSQSPWTFAHAALLSLGFVWKDHLPPVTGRGEQRWLAVVDAVNAAGAAVITANPLRSSDVQHYVHKVNDHAVVRPYHAQMWLGDLCRPRTIQAIGQSRHLGGGLLVPRDVPQGSPLTARTPGAPSERESGAR
jgi:CRISPR-associated protein Csb2